MIRSNKRSNLKTVKVNIFNTLARAILNNELQMF